MTDNRNKYKKKWVYLQKFTGEPENDNILIRKNSDKMKYYEEFGINPFGNLIVSVVIAIITLAIAVFFPYGPYVAVVFYLSLLAWTWWKSKHSAGLVINEEGIEFRTLFNNDFISWDMVGGLACNAHMGEGKAKKDGIAIIYRSTEISSLAIDESEEYDASDEGKAYFNDLNMVATSDNNIKYALKKGVEYYVHDKKGIEKEYAMPDAPNQRLWLGIIMSFCLWMMFNVYLSDAVFTNFSEEWKIASYYTLVKGHNYEYDIISYVIWIFGVYIALIFFIKFFVKDIFYVFFPFAIGIGTSLYAYTEGLSLRQKVILNCSTPTKNPIEQVSGTIINNIKESRINELIFQVNYGGMNYEVKSPYVKDAKKGMTIIADIQVGAKGYPIVRDLHIPDINWSMNRGYYKQEKGEIEDEAEEEDIDKRNDY